MARTNTSSEELVGFGVEEVADAKKMEKLYCSGRQLPSPMGSILVPLGVRAEESGASWVLLECQSSSLRYQLPIRKATRGEKTKVKEQVEKDREALCPRGEAGPRLVRRGKDLYCPRCNVKYGKMG